MTTTTIMGSRHLRRHVNSHPAEEFTDAIAVTRYWALVAVAEADECWPWQGDTDANGYGVFHWRGRMRRAHELAVSFTTGEKRPDGFDTCHSCDNPPCCNPSHLRFGTRQSNVDEMYARGRASVGERHHGARLTAAQVQEMRERRANGAIQKLLAADYGISEAYVSEIVNGLAWAEAGGPITGRAKRTQRRARKAA